VINGFPHVTQILKRAGLVDDAWFTEEARDRGSAVHIAAHYLDQGDLDWQSVHPSVLPRLRQYQRFLDEMRPEILAVEESVVNEALQYQGRLDRRYRIAGQEWLVDFKGPGQAPWQRIQTAFYAGTFPRPMRRAALHLSDERYQFIEHKDRKDWETAKAALLLAAWKETNGV
jgi:hypothetical protein